jgi:hypothetical protein
MTAEDADDTRAHKAEKHATTRTMPHLLGVG